MNTLSNDLKGKWFISTEAGRIKNRGKFINQISNLEYLVEVLEWDSDKMVFQGIVQFRQLSSFYIFDGLDEMMDSYRTGHIRSLIDSFRLKDRFEVQSISAKFRVWDMESKEKTMK